MKDAGFGDACLSIAFVAAFCLQPLRAFSDACCCVHQAWQHQHPTRQNPLPCMFHIAHGTFITRRGNLVDVRTGINSAILKLGRACPLHPRFVVRGTKVDPLALSVLRDARYSDSVVWDQHMKLPPKFAAKDELGNQVGPHSNCRHMSCMHSRRCKLLTSSSVCVSPSVVTLCIPFGATPSSMPFL